MKFYALIILTTFVKGLYAQQYNYSTNFSGEYFSESCSWNPNLKKKERLFISQTDTLVCDFVVEFRSCDQKSTSLLTGNKTYSKTGYEMSDLTAQYDSPFQYGNFEIIDGRFAFVRYFHDGYNEETGDELWTTHVYYKVEAVDTTDLEIFKPFEQTYTEEELVDMMSWEEYHQYQKDKLFPEEMAHYDWFNDFDGRCYTGLENGFSMRIGKVGNKEMGVVYTTRYEYLDIMAYFYGNIASGEVQIWSQDQGGEIEIYENTSIQYLEGERLIRYSALRYELTDCETVDEH